MVLYLAVIFLKNKGEIIKKTKIGNEKILASIQIESWKEAFTSILDQEPHCIAWWNKARMINQANVAKLLCIHSHVQYRRHDYGTKLLKRILKDIKQAGYKKMMLWIFEDNLKARKFYEANGFKNTYEIKANIQPIEIK